MSGFNEDIHRYITSVIGDGIIVLDPNKKITYVNSAALKLLEMKEGDLLGKGCAEATKCKDPECNSISPENCQVMLALNNGNESFRSEIQYTKKDGTLFPVAHVSTSIKEDGKLLGYVLSFHDISERKAYEDELLLSRKNAEDAVRVKDEYVTLVSHDLKAPLASMIHFLRLAIRDISDLLDTGKKQLFESVIETGENMLLLIEALLNRSMIKTGKIKPNKQFLDAKTLVTKSIFHFEYLAEKKGITIVDEIPQKFRIYADKVLFYEVIQNIVTNAIKFCREGDTITFYAPENKPSTIAIKDTGIGIEPEHLKSIFTSTQKKSTKGTKGETGTGVGLLFSHDIMEAHNGRLYAESELNKETTFFIELPTEKPVTLIVDDDPNYAKLMESILSTNIPEVEVIVTYNGREAIEIAKERQIHLILLDLNMPTMNGFDVLADLKSNPKLENIPVVVITGHGQMEGREKSLSMGANDFATKPIVLTEFLPRMRRFTI
ncbi:MAG: response regulator [Nitrospinota bacterium]|nr:response regulator [Nitrospinota bacterium]